MSAIETLVLTVGSGDAARPIAVERRAGNGPTLVWLGGYRSDMTGTKAIALDAFAATRGLACVRFDYSGHGRSGGRFEDGTISRWAEEARAVIDAATSGPVILIGSSMGGWIALLTAKALAAAESAKERDKVKAMVLIAPAPDFTRALMWDRFSPQDQATLKAAGRLERPSAYSSEPNVVTYALIEDGDQNAVLNAPIELACPVTILQGMDDPDVPWRHALALVDRLPTANVTLTLIRDGDHRLSRPADLDLLTEAVARIL
jgi:pimeloyl-ACP methyl ester carboxylesterase